MSDVIQVWRCDLERQAGSVELLDERERERATKFVFDRDRTRYIAAHSFVRQVLGRYVGRPPEQLAFSIGRNGKPSLSGIAGCSFNLSHSQQIAYLAIAERGEIGIDVEVRRAVPDAVALGKMVFTGAELASLVAETAAAVERRFLRCWTRKEAYVKALGVGIGEIDLCSTHVGTDANPHTLVAPDGIELEIRTIDVAHDEHVALCGPHPVPGWEVREFDSARV